MCLKFLTGAVHVYSFILQTHTHHWRTDQQMVQTIRYYSSLQDVYNYGSNYAYSWFSPKQAHLCNTKYYLFMHQVKKVKHSYITCKIFTDCILFFFLFYSNACLKTSVNTLYQMFHSHSRRATSQQWSYVSYWTVW